MNSQASWPLEVLSYLSWDSTVTRCDLKVSYRSLPHSWLTYLTKCESANRCWHSADILVLVIHIFPSCFRVHPEVCYRGGSKRAGRRRGRLFFGELHVGLFRGWGSGHGVVVKGEILPSSPHNRLPFPKEQKLRTIFIFKQDYFLQQHEDFYCYMRICSMILQNITPLLRNSWPPATSTSSVPWQSLFRLEGSASFISIICSGFFYCCCPEELPPLHSSAEDQWPQTSRVFIV